MLRSVLLVAGGVFLFAVGYVSANRDAGTVHAATPIHGNIPKSYGRLSAAIADEIGTGLIFEDSDGVIRFVSVTGRKEGELKRY